MKTGMVPLFFLAMACCIITPGCSGNKKKTVFDLAVETGGRTTVLFDADWRFFRGDTLQADNAGFDDSDWRTVDLPHDWSIEDLPGTHSPIDSNAIGGIDAGYLVGGTGWYRKTFALPADLRDKQFLLQFDGIYMNADIWLNDSHLGNHPYGYTSFRYDITKFLKPGEKNTLAVRVRNEGRNSRWYSGSGIYRHVWLEVTDQIHLDPWHTAITTPQVDTSGATVNIITTVFNESAASVEISLLSRILNPDGKEISQCELRQVVGAGENRNFENNSGLVAPALWSPGSPHLYTLVVELSAIEENGDKKPKDKLETRFGIRSVVITANHGFLLNNKPVLLKGACMHHDNGPLGAAAFDRAEERRVELMKASGYNAIRCAHNPPSPAFLDACDRLGIMVIDETFDMWREPKNPQDYHLYFEEWWQKDTESMILRDRNHPSVILWSIGNEIPERGKTEGADLARQMTDFVKKLDPSRLVTSAVNGISPDKDPYFATLDVCGYNYALDHYVSDHKKFPERIIAATESYPLEAFEYWMAVEDYPWIIGDFVWTGFDYLGEASIGWMGYPHEGSFYPWTHAYCGDIDICGWKRPQSFYRDVLWMKNQLSVFVSPPVPSFPLNPNKLEWSKWEWQDVVASWNWEGYEGKKLGIEVYSSCHEVELFLNQRSLGRKKTNRENEWIARYEVPYEPGNLSVKGYDGSVEVAASALKTSGKPVKISLTADRTNLKADGQDLSYITVELLDENGVRNPLAENLVNFALEGPGTILAVGSSNPMGTESFKQPKRKAFQGRCMVIVKSEGTPGDIRLKASSDGLAGAEVAIASGGVHP